MEINVQKKISVRFTTGTNSTHYCYSIQSIAIETVSNLKYLRAHISSDLAWQHRIDTVTSKAFRSLGIIKR